MLLCCWTSSSCIKRRSSNGAFVMFDLPPADAELVLHYSQRRPLSGVRYLATSTTIYLLLVPPKPEAVRVPEEEGECPGEGRLLSV